MRGNIPQDYEAIRYTRHHDYEHFWKQGKNSSITTKVDVGDEFFIKLQETKIPNSFFYMCVSVYVRRGSDEVDPKWDEMFFKSMGGKDHVRCQCRNFPLLPTNKSLKKKSTCNWKCCVRSNGTRID